MSGKEVEDNLCRIQGNMLKMAQIITKTNPEYEAIDLVQKTNLRVLRKSVYYKKLPYRTFESWVYIMMKRLYINDMVQVKRRRKILTDKPIVLKEETKQPYMFEDETYKNIICQLPETYQDTFKLYLLGYKTPEISKLLEIPLKMVKTNINKSKNFLKKRITKKEINEMFKA